MKHTIGYIVCLAILITSCTAPASDKSAAAKAEIIKADQDMDLLASQKGFNEALLAYAADSVIKPKEGEAAVIGKNNLSNYFNGKESSKLIRWHPVMASASASGDMGYTFGNWKLPSGDTVYYGNYATIWIKDKDGHWKFVYDGGNNTPAP